MKDIKRVLSFDYWHTVGLMAQAMIMRQYRGSFLGVLWTLIQPVTQIVIYAVVFSFVMRIPMENYAVYLTAGILLWTLISTCLLRASSSLMEHADIIKRCMISKTVFPLAEVCKHLYTYSIGFGAMCVYVVFFTSQSVTFAWGLLPFYFALLLIILMSMAITLAYITPYIRDVNDIVYMTMNVSFWLTPIVYPVTMVPESKRFLMELNPFYIMIRPITHIIYTGDVPSMHQTVTLAGVAVLSVVLGYIVYRLCRKNFVYYL